MKRDRRVLTVREVLESWMRTNRAVEYRIKTDRAVTLWDEIVDDYTKAHSVAAGIKEGTLLVKTDSPVLANELAMREEDLRAGLNRLLERPVVKKIVFKSGYVKKREDGGEERRKNEKKPRLTDLKRVDRTVEEIHGSALKEELKRLFISSLKWGRNDGQDD